MEIDDKLMKNKTAVVLCSGGMDSTVLMADLLSRGWCVEPITFQYGSKHNDAEYEALKKVCEKLQLPVPQRVDLDFVKTAFKSDLLKSGGEVPEGHYAQANMAATVVPARNVIMLSIAAGYAESVGASWVAIAAHGGDHEIYPDCRPEFFVAMSKAVRTGTGDKVDLTAPYLNLSKAQVATIGKECGAPLDLTWSCYRGVLPNHCGVCGTCVERHYALVAGTGADPTVYDADPRKHLLPNELDEMDRMVDSLRVPQ